MRGDVMRTTHLLLILMFIASLLYPGEVYAGVRKPMKELLAKRKALRTYVATIKNSSGDAKINTKALKKSFENALAARKSYRFEIVRGPKDADIRIDMEVVEFFWKETDPIDMITGYTGVIYDMVKEDHYAFMRADVKIADVKKDRSLYHDRFKATITHPTMTEEESYGMMYERISQIFLRRLFKKESKSKWHRSR
jgi:hypothetical protein